MTHCELKSNTDKKQNDLYIFIYLLLQLQFNICQIISKKCITKINRKENNCKFNNRKIGITTAGIKNKSKTIGLKNKF